MKIEIQKSNDNPADSLMEMREILSQQSGAIDAARDCLMSTIPKDITVENVLELLGLGRNGLSNDMLLPAHYEGYEGQPLQPTLSICDGRALITKR